MLDDPQEGVMREPQVVRLADSEIVKFGPDAYYQPILGDAEGTTPIRTGIQTSQPGYVAPLHSHPYIEVLHILDGVAEAWIEGGEDRPITLRKGDTIALQPNVPHSFRVVGDQALADWQWVLGVSLWDVIHGVHAFLSRMLAGGDEGHFVNTASMAGLTTAPFMSIYDVTKHGVVALSESLYKELELSGAPIGVSVVCPGLINT